MSDKIPELIRDKVYSGEWEIETNINPITGSLSISFNAFGDEDYDSDIHSEFISQYQSISRDIYDVIERRKNDDITKLEEVWEIGRIIVETENEDVVDFPRIKMLGHIFSEYSADTFSAYKRVYEAFPDKGFNEEHNQTEVREFIMQTSDLERGKRGYRLYDEHDLSFGMGPRRAWCNADEETLDELASQLAGRVDKKRCSTYTIDDMAEALQKMTLLCPDLEKPEFEEAKSVMKQKYNDS